MRIALDALPGGVQATITGNRAVIAHGDPEAPTLVSVAYDGEALILFPDRSYKHADLVKALGLAG